MDEGEVEQEAMQEEEESRGEDNEQSKEGEASVQEACRFEQTTLLRPSFLRRATRTV